MTEEPTTSGPDTNSELPPPEQDPSLLGRVKRLISDGVEAWSGGMTRQLKVLGVVLTVGYFVPWAIGDKVRTESGDDVIMAWDWSDQLDKLEDEIRNFGDRAKRKGDLPASTVKKLRWFKVPTAVYPSFLLFLGLVMAAIGFVPQLSSGARVGGAFGVLILYSLFGGWDMDASEAVAQASMFGGLFSRLWMLGAGALLIGIAGRLYEAPDGGRILRSAVVGIGVLLIVLGVLLPIKVAGKSRPLLVWLVQVLDETGGKPDAFWAFYISFVVFPISALAVAALGAFTAVTSFKGAATPTIRAKMMVSGGAFVLVWFKLVAVAAFSMLIEGVFIGGLIYAWIYGAMIVWAMALAALILRFVDGLVPLDAMVFRDS